MKKVRIGILFGGKSAEHDVSITSASSIIKNLDRDKYIVVPIYITTDGKWHLLDLSSSYVSERESCVESEVKKIQNSNSDNNGFSIINYIYANRENKKLDVIFPVLHGTLGEDGAIQGMLELLEIPYISAGILSAAMTMDKAVAKKFIHQHGIDVTPFVDIKEHEYHNGILNKILDKLRFPLFVKPSNCGSSIGISKVKNIAELEKAILEAFKYDQKILIERGIIGREIEVSVLENIDDYNNPIVSYPGELIPNDEFYSYKAKYIMEEGAKFEIPAVLSDTVKNSIRKKAGDIFKILECNCLARVDFLIESKTNRVFFSEINTLPGFTEISLYPELLKHYGIGYVELLDKLVNLAIKKHKIKQDKLSNSIQVLRSIAYFTKT